MTALLLALVTPVVGALLYAVLHEQSRLRRGFDRCMYVAVPLLVVWQIIGHAIKEQASWFPEITLLVLLLCLGVALPILIQHLADSIRRQTEWVSVMAGLSGLALHALLEGAGLRAENLLIGPPLVLHRLAVGLMLWWIIFPRYGFLTAAVAIFSLLLATLGGFLAAGSIELARGDYFQAFVLGTLLHVVFHEYGRDDSPHNH